jgi:hypothetical protein
LRVRAHAGAPANIQKSAAPRRSRCASDEFHRRRSTFSPPDLEAIFRTGAPAGIVELETLPYCFGLPDRKICFDGANALREVAIGSDGRFVLNEPSYSETGSVFQTISVNAGARNRSEKTALIANVSNHFKCLSFLPPPCEGVRNDEVVEQLGSMLGDFAG